MNIIIIAPTYPPTQGGVQTQVNLLSETLNRKGHKITIITEGVMGVPDVERKEGVAIFRLRPPFVTLDPWRSYFFIRQNIKAIKAIVVEAKADILHVYYANRSFAYAYLLKRHFAIPIVSTIQVSWQADPLYKEWRFDIKEIPRRLLKLYFGLWFEKKSILSSDWIITPSNQFNKMCKIIRNDEKITLIPNAIDLNQFNPDAEPVKLDCDGIKILCPARISPEKGQMYLVDALKIIRNTINAHVFLMGSWTEKRKQKLEAQALKLCLKDYVHFIPPCSYEKLPCFYKVADLIVLPSISEGFPIAILEDMAMGKLVVASDVGGISDAIEDRKNGLLVPPRDAKTLAEAIIEGLTNNKMREEIGRNARKKALREYDIKINIKKIEEVYRNCIEGATL